MLVKGEDEAIVRVLEQTCYPNELGVITPPITVDLEGQEYMLNHHYIENIYVYKPSECIDLEDLF